MSFLKNIRREFRLDSNYTHYLKKNFYAIRDSDFKIEDVNVLVSEISISSVELSISSIGNIDDFVDFVVESMCNDLKKDVEKFKTTAEKVVKAWEETPEKFRQQKEHYSKDTYKNRGLLSDDEYMHCVMVSFGKVSYYSDYRFSTGCGSDTYYSKEHFVKCLSEIDSWLSKSIKDIGTKKIKDRIKNQILKNTISIPISKVEDALTLFEKETTTVQKKPPFPIEFTDDELNFLLSEIGDCYIDEEIIDELIEEDLDLSELLNWEISYEHEGEHHNDGQICDYTVTFTSPEGHEYYAYNSHSLVTGWNFYGKVEIH